MRERPRRRRSRRNRFIAWAVPQLYDRPPPHWTGVPVERDAVTGKFLRGDPTGRSDKGRTGRSAGRRAALIAAGVAAVVVAAVLGAWVLGAGIGGRPTPAASGTAMPSPTEASPSQGSPAPSTGDTPSESTATGSTTTTTTGTTSSPAAAAPAAPSGLAAAAVSETAIQLTWTDESSDESGFEITDDAVVRSAAADASEFLWDGLIGGQQVCFRVRAVGDAGTSAWHPDGSPVCATTLAEQAPPDVDLRVKGLALSSAGAVCAGSSPSFDVVLANDGTQPSGPFAVQWFLDGALQPEVGNAGLAGFGSDTISLVGPAVATGDHDLLVVVDSAGQVVELDENNNTGALTFTAVFCEP